MIKSVIFDIGRVVLPIDWDRVVETLGLTRDAGHRLAHLVSTGHHYDSYERGDISTEEFFLGFEREYGLSHHPEKLKEAWLALLLPPFPGLGAVLKSLKNRAEVYALSNTNEAHYDHFSKKFEIFEHFHQLFASHHLQARKPEPQIYQSVLIRIQRQPHEVLFLDDLQVNIDAARDLGMNAERVENSVEQIKQALQAHGLWK
jgi:epoxide hydrolase-like predicted phosphatase